MSKPGHHCDDPGCWTPDDHAAPILGTVTPASVLPADCEGELRTLAREMRANHLGEEHDALMAIIDRYSGVRPMRTGKAP